MPPSEFKDDSSVAAYSYGPSIRLTIARHGLFGRVPLDSKPPRLHQTKAAVSICRQVARRSSAPPLEAVFFGSGLVGESTSIGLMMPELNRTRTAPQSFSGFLDVLMGVRNPIVLTVLGEARAPRDELVVAMANVIDGLNVDTRKIVLEAVVAGLEGRRESLRPGENEIVIQEKPGKFSVLSLPDDAALKSSARRVQTELGNMQTQRDYIAKISADDGWGAAAIAIEEVNTSNPKGLHVAASSFQWRDQQLSLSMPQKMGKQIVQWFRETTGLGSESISQIWTSAQSVSLAGRLALEIGIEAKTPKATQLVFPDFGLGWMPIASLLSGLVEARPPALFIFCEHFPNVEVVAIWR